MAKKIIFQKCHFNNIYFLFFTITVFIDNYIENYLSPDESKLKDTESNYYLPMQILNYLYISNVSDLLAIIPYFIRKKLVKKEENIINVKNEDKKNSDERHLIYNDYEKSMVKKKEIILYFFLVSIFDFLEKFAFVLYNIIYPKIEFDVYTFSCIVPFEIVFQFVCSYFILKTHFYKLQYFSLFLNLGIFIIILIIDIVNIVKNNSFDAKIFYFYTLNIISYSIEYSLGKIIILYGFISIYFLIIIRGCIVLILSILFSLIFFFVKKDVASKIILILKNRAYILSIILKIFSSFFKSLFSWLIIDRFSPNYLPFAFLSSEFCFFIVDLIQGLKIPWDSYLRLFFYLISIIGVIIHNEIVVINICNLGSDTKYFLDIEVEKEELFSNTENPEIMKRYESCSEIGEENENYNQNNCNIENNL